MFFFGGVGGWGWVNSIYFMIDLAALTFTDLAISPISTLTPTLKGSLQIVTLGIGVTVIQTRVRTLIDV